MENAILLSHLWMNYSSSDSVLHKRDKTNIYLYDSPRHFFFSSFSLILAAVMHDFHHPGVSNAFLIQSEDMLSLMYNDQSVLESFHASESYRVFRNPDYNIFKNWDKSDIKVLLILAYFRCNNTTCVVEYSSPPSFSYSICVSHSHSGPFLHLNVRFLIIRILRRHLSSVFLQQICLNRLSTLASSRVLFLQTKE